MSAEQSIQIYSIGLYVSIAVMVLGIAFAVFIFFKYRIPTVFALMTGRIRDKTVKEMQNSGMLLPEEESYAASAGSDSNGMATEDYATEALSDGMNPYRSGYSGFKNETFDTMPIGETFETTALKEAPETTALKAAAETTLLKGAAETTLLKGEAETSLLKDTEETSVLNRTAETEEPDKDMNDYSLKDISDETLYESHDNNEAYRRAGATERLDGGPKLVEDVSEEKEVSAGQAVFRGKFVSVEHTISIHTDQIIEVNY